MKIIFYGLIFITLSSCAAMQEAHQNWLIANCNPDSSYSIGVEDAQNDKKHETYKFDQCPAASVGKIKMSYSKGYNSVKNNPINIIQDIVGLSYYQCTVRAFGSDYLGSSNNQAKAKVMAMNNCKKKNHSMHCSNVVCEKTR